jgi:hypothetical protein
MVNGITVKTTGLVVNFDTNLQVVLPACIRIKSHKNLMHTVSALQYLTIEQTKAGTESFEITRWAY